MVDGTDVDRSVLNEDLVDDLPSVDMMSIDVEPKVQNNHIN